MALDDDMAVLSGAPLFGLLGPDALRLLSFAAEHRALKAGDILFRKGDRSDGGYVVSYGAIALDAREDGAPAAFVAGPSALIGQTALFVRQRRPATAVAREASGVIRVSPTLMRRVLQEFPDAALAIHEALALELSAFAGGLERVRQQLLALDGASE
jgi:CRP-like cAMP-binding protein